MSERRADAVATAGAPSIYRNRNFVRIFLAGAIELSGGQIGNVAVIFLVYASTGSATDLAIVAAAASIPLVVFGVIGGTLADRIDRRRLMIASDLVRSAGFVGLTVITAVAGYQLAPIVVVTVLNGALTAVFTPAQQALLPRIVESDQLAMANGTIFSSQSIVGFVSFAVGGTLVAFAGVVPSLAYNSLTFVASAVLVLGIRPPVEPGPRGAPGEPKGFLADVSAGFAYLRGERGLLAITLSALVSNFFLTMPYVFVVVYAVATLHGGSVDFGILLAAGAAGTAVSAPLVHRVRLWFLPNAGKVWTVHIIAFGLPILGLVFFQSLLAASLNYFLLGVLLGIGGTTWLSAAQLVVPPEMQGRYFGIDAFGSFAIIPIASVLGAIITNAYGVTGTFLIAGVGLLIVGVAGLPVRVLWRFGVPPTGGPRAASNAAGPGIDPAPDSPNSARVVG